MLVIRPERNRDIAAIHHVEAQAFGRPDEADLVDALRRRGVVTLSLVAVEDDQIVGHILFSPVSIESDDHPWEAVALGPMAVLPERQNQGIGSRLVRAGLEECRRLGHSVVIVLGHPNFYPRFGFAPSRPFGIRWEHDVPEDVFMVAELQPGGRAGRSGVVRYQPEFNGV
jgi:putative acetyltransferase